ncbi:MAG: GTPase Era [Spirochaetes bacterium]|nr:GTPase Era [Spirochaetota bacterium]
MAGKKSAFVAVVGRPSAGKSTLMNAICGGKVSIVSPVPQTTRNTVRGILNDPRGQLVFMDTPGIHDSDKRINRKLHDIAEQSLKEAEIVLYVLDSARKAGREEEAIAVILASFAAKTLACVNKIDARGSDTAGTRLFLGERLPGVRAFDTSALAGTGVSQLVDALFEASPEGPMYYPDTEVYTDQEPVFRIAEIVREKVFLHTRDEVPHAIYVDYTDSHFLDNGTLVYEADLVVERETQKGILIGAKGGMIKLIREEAEADLAEIFDYPVKLSLKVRVDPGWKKNEALLKRLIH